MKFKHLLFLGIWLLVIAAPIAAQTATPGSIRDAVQKKVAEELAAIKNEVKKRSYLGTITSKSDATITITTLRNTTRTATVTTDTIIKLSGGKDGTLADL